MNSGQRKAIRDKVKELLEAAEMPNIELFTFQKAKLSGAASAVCIYLEQGGTNGIENNAVLTIRIMAPDQYDIDDLLDSVGDQVQAVLGANIRLDGVCQFITEKDFEYDRDETEGWTVLDLRYEVNY